MSLFGCWVCCFLRLCGCMFPDCDVLGFWGLYSRLDCLSVVWIVAICYSYVLVLVFTV